MAQAQTSEGATEIVDSILFNFMTTEDVRNLSFKKITIPVAFDPMGRPISGGLYDPTMGPVDDVLPCKTCGQRSFLCPGHCGHIDLVSPLYNPLLFMTLRSILDKTCFFCYHFRLSRKKVKIYTALLDCLGRGDIIEAGTLSSMLSKNSSLLEALMDNDDPSTFIDAILSNSNSKSLEGIKWTSLQHSMMKEVLHSFMSGKSKKCENCGAKNPTIRAPFFGWFRMDMKSSAIKGNVIQGHKLDNADRTNQADSIGEVVENDVDTFAGESLVTLPDGELSNPTLHKTVESSGKRRKNQNSQLSNEYLKQRKFFSPLYLLPTEVRDIIGHLWENEGRLCQLIFDIQGENCTRGDSKSHLMFFMDALLVPPNRFRPLGRGSSSDVVEHPQSVQYSTVLQSNINLANAYMNESERSSVVPRWIYLQEAVNALFDSKKAIGKHKGSIGICQLLEKKEGIFRQKMMGKRVNFACRSVISPDPYLAVNEIGIPPYFALRLTYPERVTPWNGDKLRNAIINGSEVHPGATHYVDKLATRKLPSLEKQRRAISRKLLSSRGVITNSEKSPETEFEGKVVYRHLQDGDVVLVNRQPTLHKPSMMAHVVRVLKGEKTLRMHYANCSTYNADFDGDEMNVHFPQDEISRAELYNIANANKQYTVPTSGDPIRGLIQDHIVSAVLLTKTDTFLTRDEYHQLICASCASTSALGNLHKKVCTINSGDDLEPLPPAIWKPKPLWTGKQVISTILNYITRARPPFTVKKAGRIPRDYFGSNNREMKLLIQKNELLHGVIDKAQFGKYGLVHAVQELYGSNTAGLLLSIFSRLFTVFLQMHGFTCGVDDLLIQQKSDRERTKKLEQSRQIGEQIHSQFVGSKVGVLDPVKLQSEVEKVIRSNGESATENLDRMMSSALNRLTSDVNKRLFPTELWKPFPRNCLSLMTTTGAKGSLVNFTQISSLLGQQELEGKRVPRMVSGKTLPCFPPWDCAARAGGFISDRFLSGLRPQEYYFHCMAGRDGLVDTAIKTSRSGYLQRCLIKSLESLKVCYDRTVRDPDGSIIQFCYGEDGVDVHKTSYLSEFKMLATNQRIIREKLGGHLENPHLSKSDGYIWDLPEVLEEKAKKFIGGLARKKRDSLQLRKKNNFLNLVKLKYLSCLAQPGEAVGVIAAQSVGEPSTQMTLNTFHFAGQGEMNVTLGIPRLQEILMRASEKMQTPVMECPLKKERTRDVAERLAAELMQVTVADIVETIEVVTVPFSVYGEQVATIYKLRVKLYPPKLYPPYSNITLEDIQSALSNYIEQLETSIQGHLVTLEKIHGITDVSGNMASTSTSTADEDEPENMSKPGDDGDANGDDNEDGDENDNGVDAQKRKRQATDEIDYEDDIENEISTFKNEKREGDLSVGFESEVDQVEAGDEDYTLGGTTEAGGGDQVFDVEDEAPKDSLELERTPETRPSEKGKKYNETNKATAKRKKKDTARVIFMDIQDLDFEVHFCLKGEPHILLAEIAQQAAKNVFIKSSGKIERCSVVEDKNDPNNLALQSAGVNFEAFWKMQEDLDINNIKTNDIHAVLNTYGVEAARATIISEIRKVFGLYGISVNIRHLTLIADYMTAGGAYQPMNRHGMEKNSTSPFSKITFETASRFLVEAALHGEVERLQSSSSRVILGLPVKFGTGCFELMQNLQV
ncbi:DNA-directed RNA polymerase I subunit 1 [Aristolochia californica]|uniref:DNA-directed RNA polymerase I subunit 1 n=1 Tax=Aristolochia californica TaxID=171875 RepID=UPI0035DF4EC3